MKLCFIVACSLSEIDVLIIEQNDPNERRQEANDKTYQVLHCSFFPAKTPSKKAMQTANVSNITSSYRGLQ